MNELERNGINARWMEKVAKEILISLSICISLLHPSIAGSIRFVMRIHSINKFFPSIFDFTIWPFTSMSNIFYELLCARALVPSHVFCTFFTFLCHTNQSKPFHRRDIAICEIIAAQHTCVAYIKTHWPLKQHQHTNTRVWIKCYSNGSYSIVFAVFAFIVRIRNCNVNWTERR